MTDKVNPVKGTVRLLEAFAPVIRCSNRRKQQIPAEIRPNTWLELHCCWKDGDTIELTFSFVLRFQAADAWALDVAALSSVDTQLYDACKIDGANHWQIVVHIDFPTLVPTIVILLIMNMGSILNVGFDKIFLMQNTLNMKTSEVISTYVFNVGIKSSQFSFGSAVGLFTNVVNFVFLMLANWIGKKTTGTGLM